MLRSELDAEPAAETKQLYDEIRNRQDGEAAPATGGLAVVRPGFLRRRWTVAVASVAVIALAVWFLKEDPAREHSIVVLPFENLSGGTEPDGFVDGVTEGITTALSIVSEMTVIVYRDPELPPKTAEALGVRYVLRGSVQHEAGRVRVSAQLVDISTGKQQWAERYDRETKEASIFDLQDEITLKVVTALQVELTEGEQERMRLIHGTRNLQAWVTAADGLRHLRRLTPRDNLRARQLYDAAIAFDPKYPGAWDGLAWTHLTDAMFGWSRSPKNSLGTAGELAEKTLELDRARPGTYALLGTLALYIRQHDEAIAQGEKAVALSPSGADVAALLAHSLSYSGELERSIEMTKRAMLLSPLYPTWYAWSLGRVHRLTGDYDAAIKALKTRREGDPESLPPHVDLVIAYMWAGREGPARVEARRVRQMAPVFTVARWALGQPYKDMSILGREIEALKKAGLP
jgi:adenylate cyclase